MNTYQLQLQNGPSFQGSIANHAHDFATGEVVFNTGMVGYEETLTDPSYANQIIVFTYPLIGNYGVGNGQHWESGKIAVKGVVCANVMHNQAHYGSTQSFAQWLGQEKIPLLYNVDTRAVTKALHHFGTLNGQILKTKSSVPFLPFSDESILHYLEQSPQTQYGKGKYHIALIDCGVKQNIIRQLTQFDVCLHRLPYNYTGSLESYDGIVVSNGPGNPKAYISTIELIKKNLQANTPIFGICLGAQLLALADGADTYKLKFGHRGLNQPCIDPQTKKCYLTAQNHGYAIADHSLPAHWNVHFRHLHDHSIAGIRHRHKPFSAVQFHPEASAGPHDTAFLFEQFFEQVILHYKH